jgi:hypothetical protein
VLIEEQRDYCPAKGHTVCLFSARKSGLPRRPSSKRPKTPKKKVARRTSGWLSKFWQTVLAASVLLGIVAGVLALRLDVRVERDESLDPANVFATKFRVDNEWVFSIYGVSVECEVEHAENELESTMQNIRIAVAPVQEEIEAKQSATFACWPGINFPSVKEGVVLVKVAYRPSWWAAHVTKTERFTVNSDSEHKAHWFHQPKNSK